jgi:hypothetical protein
MKAPYSNSLEASIWRDYRKKKKAIQLSKTRDIASQFPLATMSGGSLSSLGPGEKSPPPIILFTRRVSKTGKIFDM